jgi:hydrogenase maturation protease
MAASIATSRDNPRAAGGVGGGDVTRVGAGVDDATDLGPVRVLALGNELISDDALGIVAAHELCSRLAEAGTEVPMPAAFDPAATMRAFDFEGVGRVEIVETALTGMYLLEAVVGARRLIVIDTIVTCIVAPGTVLELREGDLAGPRGGSPHYIGLLETLEMARALGLTVPTEVLIMCVEAGDYMTVGGAMTAPVESAVPAVVDRAMALVLGPAGVSA